MSPRAKGRRSVPHDTQSEFHTPRLSKFSRSQSAQFLNGSGSEEGSPSSEDMHRITPLAREAARLSVKHDGQDADYSDFIMSISTLPYIYRNTNLLADEFRFKLIYGYDQIVP